MAWLHATPKPDENSQRGQFEKAKARISRLESLRKQKTEPAMPPNPAPHITNRLVEMGITEVAGMGSTAITWLTIAVWQQCTCVTLAPWEARLIRRLSNAYLVESRLAESENRPPPWHTAPDRHAIETEQARLMAVLG